MHHPVSESWLNISRSFLDHRPPSDPPRHTQLRHRPHRRGAEAPAGRVILVMPTSLIAANEHHSRGSSWPREFGPPPSQWSIGRVRSIDHRIRARRSPGQRQVGPGPDCAKLGRFPSPPGTSTWSNSMRVGSPNAVLNDSAPKCERMARMDWLLGAASTACQSPGGGMGSDSVPGNDSEQGRQAHDHRGRRHP